MVVNLLLKLRWMHLGTLNLKSLLTLQVNKWLRSSCKHSWSEETAILLDSLVSSANWNILENFMTDGRSLMYSRKSSGLPELYLNFLLNSSHCSWRNTNSLNGCLYKLPTLTPPFLYRDVNADKVHWFHYSGLDG